MNNMVSKINNLLEQKGISCLELSRMTGIANTTLSALLKGGTSKIDIVKLNKICKALNCTLDYLMDDNVTEYEPKNNNEFTAKNKAEKDILTLFRSSEDIPDEIKEQIINQFKSNIEFYMKIKNINR